MGLKLHFHPASTASRPVLLFCVEAGIEYEPIVVDIVTGEQFQEPYCSLNPSCLVPTLEDDGFVLTESSSILKYLADKTGSPAYPKDLQARAKVNELMDWFNTNFYREWGYHFIYPQVFDHHKRQPEECNARLIAWGAEKSARWLTVLNDHWLGDGRAWLCGEQFTIADCFGAGITSIGEWVGQGFDAYPNVARWLAAVEARPSWARVNETHNGLVASMRGGSWVTIES